VRRKVCGVMASFANTQQKCKACNKTVFGGAVDNRRCHLPQVLLPMQPLQGHT
jgi:hypothetical protein